VTFHFFAISTVGSYVERVLWSVADNES